MNFENGKTRHALMAALGVEKVGVKNKVFLLGQFLVAVSLVLRIFLISI
jgi:hypothetical protein